MGTNVHFLTKISITTYILPCNSSGLPPTRTEKLWSHKQEPYPCACTHVKISHTLNCTEAVTTCNLVMCNISTRASRMGASGKKGVMQTFRTQHALRGGKRFRDKGYMPLTQKFTKWKHNHKYIQFRILIRIVNNNV